MSRFLVNREVHSGMQLVVRPRLPEPNKKVLAQPDMLCASCFHVGFLGLAISNIKVSEELQEELAQLYPSDVLPGKHPPPRAKDEVEVSIHLLMVSLANLEGPLREKELGVVAVEHHRHVNGRYLDVFGRASGNKVATNGGTDLRKRAVIGGGCMRRPPETTALLGCEHFP